MEDRAPLEQERPRTSSVPSCESMEVRLDTTTVSSATVSTTTNDATATATATTTTTATAAATAAVCWEERERVNGFLPHSPQPPPPPPLQESPPLPTLLGLGHLPTYKNQAETMIHSPDIPMAIATNLFVDGDSDVTNDTSVMIVHVPHHLSDVDICCSEANIIIPPQNHSIHRNNDIQTLNAAESFTSSMMNRRLEDQYRHMVVASYEAQASSRTEEPRIAPDFIVASTTMNHQDTNENNQDFCDIYNRTLGIEGTVSNVTGYIRSRYRQRRICYMVMLGLATIGIAITITASRRNNNTATPQMQQQQHHHPDDEEQSMMKMPSSNQNVIGANIPVVKLPIYSTEELYHAVDEYIQLQMDYTMNEIIPMDDTPAVTPEALLTFRYGYPMNHWDVSRITNFTSIFDGQRNTRFQYYFNENLSLWNVTSATTMFRMFAKLNVYVGYGLEHWNVPNVMNMRSMFHDAYIFQGNISHWDVSQVQNFDRMFTDAHLFNTNIALWNTSSAESMSAMVRSCISRYSG